MTQSNTVDELASLRQLVELVTKHGGYQEPAQLLGLDTEQVRSHYRKARKLGLVDATLKPGRRPKFAESPEPKPEVEIAELVDGDEPVEELIARILKNEERVFAAEESRRVIDGRVNIDGPIGIVGLPDQHLNNPGTKLSKALSDAKLIQSTEGLYAVAVGDWLDNFIIGRLERERRGDKMSHSDALRLQEHYIGIIAKKLLGAIGGNHDVWPESLGGSDPLGEVFKRLNKSGIYAQDEITVRLTLPSGAQFVHLLRHKFPGHSNFNTGHGVLKWMLERWRGEDVFWGGHIHAATHMHLQRESLDGSKIVRGVQLPSYKAKDGYAVSGGFRKNVPFVSPVVIHDPYRMKTLFFEDIEDGIAHLQMLRSK